MTRCANKSLTRATNASLQCCHLVSQFYRAPDASRRPIERADEWTVAIQEMALRGLLVDYLESMAGDVWRVTTNARTLYRCVQDSLLLATTIPSEGYLVLSTGFPSFSWHEAAIQFLNHVADEMLGTDVPTLWRFPDDRPPIVRREKQTELILHVQRSFAEMPSRLDTWLRETETIKTAIRVENIKALSVTESSVASPPAKITLNEALATLRPCEHAAHAAHSQAVAALSEQGCNSDSDRVWEFVMTEIPRTAAAGMAKANARHTNLRLSRHSISTSNARTGPYKRQHRQTKRFK